MGKSKINCALRAGDLQIQKKCPCSMDRQGWINAAKPAVLTFLDTVKAATWRELVAKLGEGGRGTAPGVRRSTQRSVRESSRSGPHGLRGTQVCAERDGGGGLARECGYRLLCKVHDCAAECFACPANRY